MTRKVRITIDVIVDDLSEEERATCYEEMCLEEEGETLPSLADHLEDDYDRASIVGHIVGALSCEPVNEIFWEGSDLFVRVSDAEVVDYKWNDEDETN